MSVEHLFPLIGIKNIIFISVLWKKAYHLKFKLFMHNGIINNSILKDLRIKVLFIVQFIKLANDYWL